MISMPWKQTACAFVAVLALLQGQPATAQDAPDPQSWTDLREVIFGARAIETDGFVTLEAPARAPDPAVVPVTIRLAGDEPVTKITLIVDENPAPVAATFTLAENSGIRAIETRLRVNAYSNIRAVAETGDGRLHQAVVYVKASGGCAAPAARNPQDAAAALGEMRLRRLVEAATGKAQEAQLMIRHPNNSGLQRDQVTHLYIPALLFPTWRFSLTTSLS